VQYRAYSSFRSSFPPGGFGVLGLHLLLVHCLLPRSYLIAQHPTLLLFLSASTLLVKLKVHHNSFPPLFLPLSFPFSLYRSMFKFTGRHQFPEQSGFWQVSSPLLCTLVSPHISHRTLYQLTILSYLHLDLYIHTVTTRVVSLFTAMLP
jgi:hypothetical protein